MDRRFMKSKQELLSIHDKQPAGVGHPGRVDAVMARADQATCTEHIASIEKFMNAGCFQCSGLIDQTLLRVTHPAQAHTPLQVTIERITRFTGLEDQIACFSVENKIGERQSPHADESSRRHHDASLHLHRGD
jgi:hypothetical protein